MHIKENKVGQERHFAYSIEAIASPMRITPACQKVKQIRAVNTDAVSKLLLCDKSAFRRGMRSPRFRKQNHTRVRGVLSCYKMSKAMETIMPAKVHMRVPTKKNKKELVLYQIS